MKHEIFKIGSSGNRMVQDNTLYHSLGLNPLVFLTSIN